MQSPLRHWLFNTCRDLATELVMLADKSFGGIDKTVPTSVVADADIRHGIWI